MDVCCGTSEAAFEFIEKRNKQDLVLLQQAAAGIEAMEVLLRRCSAAVELLRPLALQQQRLEQVRPSLCLLKALSFSGHCPEEQRRGLWSIE